MAKASLYVEIPSGDFLSQQSSVARKVLRRHFVLECLITGKWRQYLLHQVLGMVPSDAPWVD